MRFAQIILFELITSKEKNTSSTVEEKYLNLFSPPGSIVMIPEGIGLGVNGQVPPSSSHPQKGT